ncbi:hypothetical protein L596_003877 [Steinernema carpocapsae]|uniref:Uncharacterized protein n=1 Tax=Steinernema carpocapsae TaxID=34508 RepID=A0A4U8UVK1_STECR|nr:hypothetical protein L596_003877 [Steinernema carpocapsae]
MQICERTRPNTSDHPPRAISNSQQRAEPNFHAKYVGALNPEDLEMRHPLDGTMPTLEYCPVLLEENRHTTHV